MATLVHGEPRNTQDVDLVIELVPPQAEALVAALESQFFVDLEFVGPALRKQISFNVVHRTSGLKLDFFLLRNRAYSRTELDRAAPAELAPYLSVRVASAEDCVLTKLEWYRKGKEVSDRQWRDVLGVLKVQRRRLDLAYLRRWASELAIDDLLARAFGDAGIP